MRNAYFSAVFFKGPDGAAAEGVAYMDDAEGNVRMCPLATPWVREVRLWGEDIVGLVAVGLAAMSLAEMTDIYDLVKGAVELAAAKGKTAA